MSPSWRTVADTASEPASRIVWRWRSNAGQPLIVARTGIGMGPAGIAPAVVVGEVVVGEVVVGEVVVGEVTVGGVTATRASGVKVSSASGATDDTGVTATPGTATGAPAPHAVIPTMDAIASTAAQNGGRTDGVMTSVFRSAATAT
jgi:hypothetical protein